MLLLEETEFEICITERVSVDFKEVPEGGLVVCYGFGVGHDNILYIGMALVRIIGLLFPQ